MLEEWNQQVIGSSAVKCYITTRIVGC